MIETAHWKDYVGRDEREQIEMKWRDMSPWKYSIRLSYAGFEPSYYDMFEAVGKFTQRLSHIDPSVSWIICVCKNREPKYEDTNLRVHAHGVMTGRFIEDKLFELTNTKSKVGSRAHIQLFKGDNLEEQQMRYMNYVIDHTIKGCVRYAQ